MSASEALVLDVVWVFIRRVTESCQETFVSRIRSDCLLLLILIID